MYADLESIKRRSFGFNGIMGFAKSKKKLSRSETQLCHTAPLILILKDYKFKVTIILVLWI